MAAGLLKLAEGTTNGTPASGYGHLEVLANGYLYFVSDSGTSYQIAPVAKASIEANAVSKVQTVTRDTQQSTTSTSYVDITSMTLTTIAAADVLVFYTDSMQHGTAGANMYIQIVQGASSVQQVKFVSTGGGYLIPVTAHACLAGVSAGTTIKMQMKVDAGTIYSNADNSAAGRARLTIVELYK